MYQEYYTSLLEKAREKYELKLHNLQLGGKSWEIYSVANFDEMFDKLIEEEAEAVQDEFIPYWVDLWPSSIALANFIYSSPLFTKGTRILEMGCGLGLAGLSAASKGAEVIFTDFLSQAFELVRLNAYHNLGKKVRCQQMDWRKPDLSLNPDLIIASDVAYEKSAFKYLIRAFLGYARRGSTIILSEPNRFMAKSFVESFELHGFEVEFADEFVQYQNLSSHIRIYTLRAASVE